MTKVEICNLALGWLARERISHLDAEAPASIEERLCADLYDAALLAVLEAKAWTFATARLTLEPVVASGLADWPFRAVLPGTVVRVLDLDDGSGCFDMKWAREGDAVLFAEELTEVHARVLTFEEDPTKYPPGFVRALAARLAADLAGPLTESAAHVDRMEKRFLYELSVAGARDGKQGSVQIRTSSWWRTARGG